MASNSSPTPSAPDVTALNEHPAGISVDPQLFILDTIAPERIVVINLDRRPDRWEALLAAWQPELSNRFVRFSATDGNDLTGSLVDTYATTRRFPTERAAAEIACRDSWLRAVTEHGPGLYFEDDARPCAPWSFGSPPVAAEIVLLGGELWNKTSDPGWVSVERGLNGSHSIWIRSQQAADALLAAWSSPRNRFTPVDYAWRSALGETGAVVAVPQILCQANLGTDVQIGRVFPAHEPPLIDPWCSLFPRRPDSVSNVASGAEL